LKLRRLVTSAFRRRV